MKRYERRSNPRRYCHPYMGYRRIELVEKLQYTWLARICGSGKEIEVWEDEFELD